MRALARLADDEVGELAKLARLRSACCWAGAALVAVAFAAGDAWGWSTWGVTLAGAAGGLVVGPGLHYDNSLNQWPVLGRYFDTVAVRRDAATLDEK